MSRFCNPRVFVILIVLLIVSAFPATAQETPPSGDDEDDLPPGVVHVDQETAFAHDAALMAEQVGMSVDEAERAMRFQDSFTIFGMEVLLPRYEDQISGIWSDPAPATRGFVWFVEEVPQEVGSEAATRGLDIVFMDGGEISMAEHDLRSDLVAEALIDAGYRNLLVYPDRKSGTISINLRIPADTYQPDEAEIVALVRDQVAAYQASQGDRGVLEGRAAEIRPSDIVITVGTDSEPFAEPAATRGGNRVQGASICTSGWTVNADAGQGIITAAHCTGITTFVETNGAQYPLNFVGQAPYSFGDVEYHTSPQQLDFAEFYATAVEIRDVTLIRARNMMVGQGVCVYGRSSSFRSCAHTVKAVNVTVNVGGIGPVSKQAWVTGSSGVTQGDSGGGWSTNTWAWGITSSFNQYDSFYTPAQVAEAAFAGRDLEIMTK
jgi:hypothetical protein